jgi:hypothetical protein
LASDSHAGLFQLPQFARVAPKKRVPTGNSVDSQRQNVNRTRSRGRPPKKEPPDFVNSWDELARRVGRSRRCLLNWRKRFKDDPKFPWPRGDRHSVSAWLQWMKLRNLADAPDEGDDAENTKAFWDRQRARLEFERTTFSFAVEKGEYLPLAEIEAAVGQLLAGFRTALNIFPSSAARWIVGLKDVHAIKSKLQSEVDSVLQSLGRVAHVDDVTPTVLAKLFPDRDVALSRNELVRACDQVFQEIGRQSLSDLLQRSLPPFSAGPATADGLHFPGRSVLPAGVEV